jgi:hypothetical protein
MSGRRWPPHPALPSHAPLAAPPAPPTPRLPALLAARWLAACALLPLLLGACAPLYVPLIPGDMLVPDPAFRLHGDARLEHEERADGHSLTLHLRADEVPGPGWLAVQWFGPSGPARASESLWFEPDDVGAERTLRAPEHLRITRGEWRAVLSWQGRLVRQLLVVIP